MKKTIFLLLLAVAMIGTTTANACFRCSDGSLDDSSNTGEYCPVPTPAPTASIGGSICIDCLYGRIKDVRISVDGNQVRAEVSTTQMMNVWIAYDNEDIFDMVGEEGEWTYRVFEFEIPVNGIFTLYPQSMWQGQIVRGGEFEVNITGNEEVAAIEVIERPEFKDGLDENQITGLLSLWLNKVQNLWTDIDWKNWNYAIK